MNWIIRKVDLKDVDALFLLAEAFVTTFKLNREAFEVSIKELMGDESAWLSVAESEGELIGYCLGFDHYTLFANGRISWVEEIMVKDNFRWLGVGQTLMEAFEIRAKSRGSSLVALATRRAASFYTALGYEESATYFRKLL